MQTRSRKPKVISTHDDQNEVFNELNVALQVHFLDVWSQLEGDVWTLFFDDAPQLLNVFRLGSWDVLYNKLLTWQHRTSDTHGCIDLHSSQLARPQLCLEDAKTPQFLILENLKRQRWKPLGDTIVHADLTKCFDARDITKKKLYLLCLHKLEQILAVNGPMHSNQPQLYYQLLFNGQRVQPNLGHEEYKKLYRKLRGLAHLQLEDGTEAAESAHLQLENGAAALPLCDDDDFEVGGERVVIAKKPKKRARRGSLIKAVRPVPEVSSASTKVATAPEASSSTSGCPSSSSSSTAAQGAKPDAVLETDAEFEIDGVAVVPRGEYGDWVEFYPGITVKYENYKPRGKPRYRRWILKCCYHGSDCIKKRSFAKTSIYGDVTPVAYLAAWQALGDGISEEEHRDPELVPAEVDVAVLVHELHEDFQAKLARFVP